MHVEQMCACNRECVSMLAVLTWMPIDFMCAAFFISRMRPEAASRALEGTQPRFTHVPPMSCPSMTATFMPCGTNTQGASLSRQCHEIECYPAMLHVLPTKQPLQGVLTGVPPTEPPTTRSS